LLMARRPEEAFNLAQQHNEMETYAQALGEDGTKEDYLAIAEHYEKNKEWARAGKYYGICQDYNKAVKFLLQAGEASIEDAIKVVEKAKGTPDHAALGRAVYSYLVGEPDGKPKDQKWHRQLAMAMGDFARAAEIAVLIANGEQKLGNYGGAHAMLYETYRDLVSQKIPVPSELRKSHAPAQLCSCQASCQAW